MEVGFLKENFLVKKIFVMIIFIAACCIVANKSNATVAMSKDLTSHISTLAKEHEMDQEDEKRCIKLFNIAFDKIDKEVYSDYKSKVYDSIKKRAAADWFASNILSIKEQRDEVLVNNMTFVIKTTYLEFRAYWESVINYYFDNEGSEIYEQAEKMAIDVLQPFAYADYFVENEEFCSRVIDRICLDFNEDFMMQLCNEKATVKKLFKVTNEYDLIMTCFYFFMPAEWYNFSKMPDKFSSSHEFAEKFQDTIIKVKKCVEKETAVCKVPQGNALIIGDLHGNIHCTNIFISEARIALENHTVQSVIFLGDYIDRGFFSTEVLYSILKFKLDFPDKVFLIRGNHEMRGVKPSTFMIELECRFSSKDVFFINKALFDELFTRLPLAAEITTLDNKKILCVHGGIPEPISSNYYTFIQMKKKNSYDIVPIVSLCPNMKDNINMIYSILWSDPERPENDQLALRTGRISFTKDQLDAFLKKFKYEYLIRGHECVSELFSDFDGKCYTVFSSHNYCGDNNDAHMAIVTKDGISDYLLIKGDGSVGKINN